MISVAIWAHRFLFFSKTSYVSILLWVNNTFIILSNFSTFHKRIFFSYYWNGKIMKVSAGFKHMTYRFIVNILTYCAMLLGDKYDKTNIPDLIGYFDKKYATICRCLIPP